MLVFYYLSFILLIGLLFTRLQRLFPIFTLLFLVSTLYFLAVLSVHSWVLIAIGLLFVGVWLVLSVGVVRAWLLNIFAKKFIHQSNIGISETEKIAMQSGDTHWEENLFSARLDWDKLHNVQTQPLSQEECDFIAEKVPALCQQFYQHGMSRQTLEEIKNQGFWAFNIPKKYGGLDFCAQAHATILAQLSVCDVSLAVTVMVPNSLGPGELILHYGEQTQKQSLLPKLASGEHIPCFALTSTDAGSDAGAMRDTGVVCEQIYKGKKTLGLKLNWEKRYTTLAPIATLIGLAFKTYDPDGLLGGNKTLGISCALVDVNLPGVDIGRYHHPIGGSFANGPHQGRDVFIPLSAVIGGRQMLGKGWAMLMESLSLGRGISLPSLSLAGCELGLKSSLEYSLLRRQFKQGLYRFQGIAEKIIPMAADIMQMQAMSIFHLNLLDQGINPSLSSAILKYHHTEALRTHLNTAMDIHAGKAIMLGDKNYLSNIYAAIPIAITVEGANILTRSMIIFGQGLMRCHPYLKDEIAQLANKNTAGLSLLLGKHLQHIIWVKTKSFFYGLNAALSPLPRATLSKVTRPYYQKISALSASFAFLVEIAVLKFGIGLKFQESINGLFADVLIRLYALSTTLKFYDEQRSDSHTNLIHWIGQTQSRQIQLILLEISQQFKLSSLLRLLILPRGISQKSPKLSLQNQLIKQLIGDPVLKNALTKSVILPYKSHPLKQLDKAFKLALQAEEIYQSVGFVDDLIAIGKLLNSDKINQQQHDLLVELTQLRADILSVNDYARSYED